MTTIVTQKNRVTIPAEVGRKLGTKPGWTLDWQPIEGKEEILVRVIPTAENERVACWELAASSHRRETPSPRL